ncbi:MAG TPA: indole-3-glycerol phosphate synthase TrpC [Chitinophagaceae bacterium]|nr:indole-3-glycerol phosphate synthase TrpC [Chitinophagaceae bacterium]
MNILEEIIASKRKYVKEKKDWFAIRQFESSSFFDRECESFVKRCKEGGHTGIIAEFKRKSPSKGIINEKADILEVVSSYEKYGAAAISVLTDEIYFGGSNDDLWKAKSEVDIPVLRKDFIIDEFQVLEAKSIGADAILLIAACLSKEEVKRLAAFAKSIGLEVLLELHDEQELDHICEEADMIGINNRDLKNFGVNKDRSLKMAEKIAGGKLKIAESGITTQDDIRLFRENGFIGFLIGELFMKDPDPGKAFHEFIRLL